MTALSDALEAAQAKALAALEKGYLRERLTRDELLTEMNNIGLRDEMDQVLLIHNLDVLRALGQTEPTYTERRKTEKATDAQLSYIAKLADEKGYPAPDVPGVTKAQASEIINSLQNGTYDQTKWDVPF